jgi:hypothetical protein
MVLTRAAAAGWASARGSSEATTAMRTGAAIDRTCVYKRPPGAEGSSIFVTVSAQRELRQILG